MAVVVPRVFHRIWLGSRIPPEFVRFGQSWLEVNPGWTMILWTEDNLPEMRNRHLFDAAADLVPESRLVYRFRSNLLRYEVVEQFGGIYLDTDFEALRPIEPVIDGLDCFAVEEKPGLIANGLLGAVPGHPFIRALVDGAADSVQQFRGHRSWITTGPAYLTRAAKEHPGALHVLPSRLFLPYHHRHLNVDGTPPDIPGDAIAHHVWGSRRKQVSVIVPFRPSDEHRARSFAWLVDRLESEHPDWQVVPADCDGEWSKPRAILNGIRASFGDIIAVHDADSWCPGLPDAVDAVRRGAPWAMPHSSVVRLDEASSQAFMAEPEVPIESLTLDRPRYTGVRGGGCLVLPRTTAEAIPPDVRFSGWGGEDEAWGDALDTLAGEGLRIDEPLVHLWHPRDGESLAGMTTTANGVLAALYRGARGNPGRMAHVMANTPDGETITLRHERTGRTRLSNVGTLSYFGLLDRGWRPHIPPVNRTTAVGSPVMAGDILHGIGKRPRITRAETAAQDAPKQDATPEPVRAAPNSAQTSASVNVADMRQLFDPGAHTVAQVLAYVVGHPDEVADIVLAEQAGKGRKRIIALGDDLPF